MGIFGYVALLVASTLIMRVLAPKPKGPKAAALEDFTVPTAEVGRPIPWVFGTRKIKDPNCIWYGDLRTNRKKKDDGTFFWYYMGLHLEICIGPVDEIKRIWYGDKMCWDGSIAETTYGTVINQQNLYGGIRSEGGIWIAFDAMFGDADQPANAYMESQLGAPVSAFRDSLTLVFHQGIISANSAYVRPIMPLVQRIYAGWADECWFPETASIAAPIAAINPMHGELYREIMRHRPGLYIGFEEAPDEFGAFTGSITNWGSGQNGTYIGTLPRHGGIVPHGSQSVGCVTPNGGVTFPQNAKYSYTTNDVVMLACKLRLSQSFRSAAVDGRYYLWLEGRLQDANNHGLGALFILDDVNGDRLEVSYKGASDLDWNGAHIVLPEGTLTNGAEFFLALRITKTGGTHGTGMISLWLGCNATFVGSSSFPAKAITPTRDAVLVRIGHGSGGDVPDHPIYAEVDDFAIFTSHLAQSSIENLARAYCSDRDYDMNPAHIISNVWTDQHQGMAYDPAMIDDAAMRYCAQLLYDEEFGISLYWARQESIENFVAEVCRHADLLQSINPRTGQLRLIALRDDYDIEDLIEITEDDIIEIVEWQETASGEGTNTVTVTYEDRNGDQQAATYQNRAAALHYGVIAQTIDYPGITTAELAMRVAERECRKLGGNFAKGKIKCNRLPWDIMPGAVFVLSHGPEGIGPLVVRVLEWSGGTLTSGAITLNVVQDVFSLKHDVSRFFPQSGEWTAPDTAAAPCENETVQEMPYWMTRNVYGVAETSTMPVEAGYILALGTRPTPTTTDIDIWSGVPPAAVVQTAEDRGIVPTATLAAAIDYLDGTDIELADSVDLGDVQPGWLAQIGEGSGAEIVLVDSIDGQHIAITRGVLDTVPHQWPIGERLYFISSSPSEWPYSPVQYANGDDVAVKLQAGSRAGEIDIEEAASLSITMASRIARPYPPGAVKVNAIYFPSVWDDWSELEITWAHRDRIEQTAPVEWTAASIGPESGTTYTVQAYGIDEDGVETRFYQATGISGTTDTIDLDTYPLPVDAAIVSVRVWSVRDGLASWQHVATNIINLTDPPWDHVIALLHFDETSGATKLIDQSRYGRVWTPTNAATSDSVVLVDGNCLSLAGPATPSWLETSKSGLTIGSSDWTIEAAIRIAALPGAGKLYGILGTGNKDSPYYSMRFFISDSGEIGVTLSSDGAATTIIKSAASAISTDTTYRVCAERDDSTVRVYVDGIVVATGSYSSSVYLSSGSPNMYIGRLLDQSDIAENQGIFAGKIDEFRWVIGTAIYHGITYTPSAYPFPDVRNATPDPYWSDTKALLHFDSDYTDVASGSWSEDGGSLSISGSTYVYGGGALRVPSGTSRLKRSGLSIGSGAFTVEARARADSLSTSFIIFDCRNAHEDSSGFVVALRSTGKLLFGTGSPFAATEGTTVLTADTWYRVMVTRSVNGVVRLFLDGNLEAQVTESANMSRANWYVGRTVDSSGSAGYIDELRITVGAARTPDNWTTAAAFPHGS